MSRRARANIAARIAMLIAGLTLAGCAVGPDYVRPTAVVPTRFKELEGWKEAQPRDHEIAGKWWEIFNDAQLNSLEDQVDLANQSLAQAEAQYRQAQALVQGARAAFFPSLLGSASVERFQARGGQNLVVPGVKNLYAMSLDATWELDLWGSVRRQVESNTASAQASAANLQALRLSTQATLAQNYFQLRTLDAQQKVLNESVAAYEKALQLTRNRYAVGVAAQVDVVQAQTQLESTRAQAIDVGVQRAQLEHAIALLIGKAPADLSIPVAPLTATPPAIPAGFPSELLERRPDVAAAEREVKAANAQIGVAKAAYFPSLTLSAQSGYQSNTLAQLTSTASRFWALGPAVAALTLFDGGARSAQMKQAIAGHDANVAAYRQTVLTSFQEVENNLAALRILEQEAQAQDKAVRAARRSVVLTTNQYKAGIVSYLNVITVQTAALANERTAVTVLGQRLGAAVLLVKALGGGWNTSALPGPRQVGGKMKWNDYLPFPPP